jgi:alpha-maltose-1-phosphate synthase
MSHGRTVPRSVLFGFDFYARYATDLAKGMLDIGWHTLLLRRDHDLEFGGVAGAQDAYVRRQLGSSAQSVTVPGRVRDLRALPDLRHARRAVRAYRPEVVHLQDEVINDPRIPLVAGARLGRYALTSHDPTVHPGDARPTALKRVSQRALVEGAGLVFVHSDALGEELRRGYRVRAPIVVVPHGADVTPCPAPGDPRVALFFGRVSHYKGLDVLLDAMQLVWERVPDARLVVAGQGDWPEHRALEDQRVEVRRDHVPEAEVDALFCRAGCVVLPYRQASQSGVGSLARRFGRALVVTGVGGLPDLVSDASGRVVAPESPVQLAQVLVELMRGDGVLEAMGRAASRELEAEASWISVAQRTAEAYERHLLQRRRR